MASKIKKSALILGVTGQDGTLMAVELLKKGWEVHGGFRRGFPGKLWRLEESGILDKIKLVNFNLNEPYQIMEIIRDLKPDHIYNFAGESFVADSFIQPLTILETNCIGALNVLEAVRISSPESRVFFASSSEVFGPSKSGQKMNESQNCMPKNPYGISKMAAQHMVRIYRENYGLHVISGIMFNHESHFRARNFVTRKITYNIARLKIDGGDPIELGSVSAARDWGSAVDFMQLIHAAMLLDVPQDYVYASGKITTVNKILTVAAESAGFEPVTEGEGESFVCYDRKSGLKLAKVSSNYYRQFDTPAHEGDPSKILKVTGFGKMRDISEVIMEMVQIDIDRRKRGHIDV